MASWKPQHATGTIRGTWESASEDGPARDRGPKDHINTRISHSGSKAQYKGDIRYDGLWDPYAYVVFWGPKSVTSICIHNHRDVPF